MKVKLGRLVLFKLLSRVHVLKLHAAFGGHAGCAAHGFSKDQIPKLCDDKGIVKCSEPPTKRRRTKREEKVVAEARLQSAVERQEPEDSKRSTNKPPPPLLGGLPAVAAQDGGETKHCWSCRICGDFHIHWSTPVKEKVALRDMHWKRFHGFDKAADLRKEAGKWAVHLRQDAAEKVFDKRWKLVHQKFQAERWKGSHDIEEASSSWRPSGKRYFKPYHRCKALVSFTDWLPLFFALCARFSALWCLLSFSGAFSGHPVFFWGDATAQLFDFLPSSYVGKAKLAFKGEE